MIWDDPWITVATQERATTLLPPLASLPAGATFGVGGPATVQEDWVDLVGTRWSLEAVRARLSGAMIPMLYDASGVLMGTCVLRWQVEGAQGAQGILILETLRAHRGWGTPLMRAAVAWVFRSAGGRGLMFTWELSGPALAWAWMRGWLAAAVEIQRGWAWTAEGCGWCPDRDWRPVGSHQLLNLGGAVVSDSGQGDGWGHVCTWSGSPDWAAVAKAGGWRRLWIRATKCPGDGWRWTGEIVVVAALGQVGPTTWISAEI
jgi:hypothetical protein